MGRKKKKKKAAARRRREEQEDERKASTSAMAMAAADSEEEITAASSSTTLLPPNPPLPAPFMVAPVGLRNLGNTCFFNSVMQCLYGISELRRADLSIGRVSKALGMFFRMYDDSSRRHCKGDRRDYVDTFHAGSAASGTKKTKKTKKSKKKDKTKAKKHNLRQPRSGTISPLGLLNEIRKKAPWLKGFRQQDAHELLRFLIDIVDTEQKKHALRRTKQCNATSLNGVVDSGDRKTRKEAAANVTSSTESGTIITNVFGAVLASHVTCATCGYISERLERCSDVSLEIPAPTQKRRRKKNSNNKGGAQCLKNGELQPLSTGRGSKSQRKKARRKAKQQDSRADTEGRKHESSLVNIVASDGDESGKGNDVSRQGLSGKGTKAQRKKAAKERRAARLRARMEAEELEFLEQSPGGDRKIQEMPETDISAHVRTDGDQKKAEKTFTPDRKSVV